MRVLTHNRAVGPLSGVALAGILFSRKVAKVIDVTSELPEPGHRVYSVRQGKPAAGAAPSPLPT